MRPILQARKAPPEPNAEQGFQPADLSQPLSFSSHAWALQLDSRTGAIVGLQPAASAGGAVSARAGDRAGCRRQCGASRAGLGGWLGAAQRVAAQWLGTSLRAGGSRGSSRAGEACEAFRQGPGLEGAPGLGTGASLASPENPLAQIVYSSYSGESTISSNVCHESHKGHALCSLYTPRLTVSGFIASLVPAAIPAGSRELQGFWL